MTSEYFPLTTGRLGGVKQSCFAGSVDCVGKPCTLNGVQPPHTQNTSLFWPIWRPLASGDGRWGGRVILELIRHLSHGKQDKCWLKQNETQSWICVSA